MPFQLPALLHASSAVDKVKCYTNTVPNSAAGDLLLSSISYDFTVYQNRFIRNTFYFLFTFLLGRWNSSIYEDLIKANLVSNHRKNGYKDFKYVYYGNNEDGPMSFHLHLQQPGQVSHLEHICICMSLMVCCLVSVLSVG